MPGSIYSENCSAIAVDGSVAELNKEQNHASKSAQKEEALREQRLRNFRSESGREAPWSSVNRRGFAGGEGGGEGTKTQ
ncbi:hypothetical protein BELL_0487g00020 [Botrytis elliptica]|uniref:Uncharacterized protein n=1 Tax=Botrytis elliptica TaxID=278938 RepID=A0A4Z1JEU4_9HELO|nr:hypothetical protein EAE99_011293 [Botrytis elliptica]TGO72155.1 hypothetical protein BELL_0487g00020 [Botrytis elliptica]